jgi:hypothetical protein
VTSVETRPNNPWATSWTICLDYNEQPVYPHKVKFHKLAPELPYHDIKPPTGVRVIKVEAVNVNMLLRNTPAVGVIHPVLCGQDRIESGNVNARFNEECLFSGMVSADEGQLCSSDDAGICDFDHLQSSTPAVDNIERQSSKMLAAESSCAYLSSPPSQEAKELQDSGKDIVRSSTYRVSTEKLIASLETGLRHVMCEPPRRNAKANKIIGNEDFDCLPIIAPALWLPNYHRSLSERAIFLPTISHAIANVSGHSSAKFGLKVKAWQLSQRHPHKGGSVFSAKANVNTSEVQKALSVDLWAAMASGLNHTRTAEQSRPLRDIFEAADGADALGEAELMLDEIATACGSDGTYDESEFEDLLNTASEHEDGSLCNLAVSDIDNTCGPIWTEAFGAPLDRLPNRWNSEHPSRLNPESDLFEDSTELYGTGPCGGLVSGAEVGGGSFGSHREIGQCWDGSDSVHDSEVLQYPEMEGAESKVDDMLLWDLEHVGAQSPSEQVDLPMSVTMRDSDELREDEDTDTFSDIEFAVDSEC